MKPYERQLPWDGELQKQTGWCLLHRQRGGQHAIRPDLPPKVIFPALLAITEEKLTAMRERWQGEMGPFYAMHWNERLPEIVSEALR